jgi:DNA-binding NarL/FixJ family response regulator
MTRLLLFTDEPVLTRGLESVFSSNSDFELVSACDNTRELLEGLLSEKPDLLLTDLSSDFSFSGLVEVQRRFPDLKVVLWVRTIVTELAYQAIEHGVRGILRKTLPAETLFKCLQMVSEGGLWFEETLKSSFSTARAVSLTRREGQLVSLLSHGLKNKEIAATLFITEGTVKVYLSRLFQKLGVKDRFELALFGLKNMPTESALLEMPKPQAIQPQRTYAGQAHWLRSLVMEKPNVKVGRSSAIFES